MRDAQVLFATDHASSDDIAQVIETLRAHQAKIGADTERLFADWIAKHCLAIEPRTPLEEIRQEFQCHRIAIIKRLLSPSKVSELNDFPEATRLIGRYALAGRLIKASMMDRISRFPGLLPVARLLGFAALVALAYVAAMRLHGIAAAAFILLAQQGQ